MKASLIALGFIILSSPTSARDRHDAWGLDRSWMHEFELLEHGYDDHRKDNGSWTDGSRGNPTYNCSHDCSTTIKGDQNAIANGYILNEGTITATTGGTVNEYVTVDVYQQQ